MQPVGSLAFSASEKRGEESACGGSRAALAGDDLAFGLGEPPGHFRRAAKALEELIADLGPQCRLRLRSASPPPGAARFERGAKPRGILPDRVDAVPGQCRDGPHRDL